MPCVRPPTFRFEGRQDCARSAKSDLEVIRDDPGARSARPVTASPPALLAHRRRSGYYAARPPRWPHRPLAWTDGPISPGAAAVETASIESWHGEQSLAPQPGRALTPTRSYPAASTSRHRQPG